MHLGLEDPVSEVKVGTYSLGNMILKVVVMETEFTY